jgi:hypothetical protein
MYLPLRTISQVAKEIKKKSVVEELKTYRLTFVRETNYKALSEILFPTTYVISPLGALK